jgi:hypothetical protein
MRNSKAALLPAAFVVASSASSGQKVSDTRVDTGDPPGSATSGSIDIASTGTAAFVAWQDRRNGPTGDDIHFNRTLDG